MFELFKLFGTIGIDNKDADDAIDHTVTVGQSAANKLGNVVAVAGKAMLALATTTAASIGAMATGIGVLAKQAVDSYGEYEQLVGGAELMYGEAYDFIADKARNAFRTVQMSQNDYLQQVNGFATGLKVALNGDSMAAAQLADRILKAEADVVAATGNSQEAVQNAFNGIMKSNYTMLDNLQIGIKPTKEGMQEVIDKVNEWNAANGQASNYVIDNLADCQSALVDYIEMQGLSNYAAREASQTISGSLASVQAAWNNLLTGMADSEQNMGVLITNLSDSIGAFAKNMIPRIAQALPEVITGLTGVATQLAGQAPELITRIGNAIVVATMQFMDEFGTVVPSLIDTLLPLLVIQAEKLVKRVLEKLPSFMEALLPNIGGRIGTLLSSIFSAGIEVGTTIFSSLISIIQEIAPLLLDMAETLLPVILDVIQQTVPVLLEVIETILPSALEALMPIVEMFPELVPLITEILNVIVSLIEPTKLIIESGIVPLITIITQMVVQLLPSLIPLLQACVDFITLITNLSVALLPVSEFLMENIGNLFNGIATLIGDIITFVSDEFAAFFELLNGDIDGFWQKINQVLMDGYQIIFDFVMVIIGFADSIWKRITGNSLIPFFETEITWMKVRASNFVTELIATIQDTIDTLKQKISDFFTKVKELIKTPHFKVDGEFSLNPLKVPSIGVDWYAKAMDNPLVMNKPTAFGINALGQVMAGGEAGTEIVSGADTLMNMIASAVSAQNKELINVLVSILNSVNSIDTNMPDNLKEALSGTGITTRDFARLVKAVN